MKEERSLSGHCALIAGASHGSGLVVAGALAALGCDLHLAALEEDVLKIVAQNIRERFDINVEAHPADLRDPINAAALMLECEGADILVCAFGSLPDGGIETINDEEWRRAFDLKVFGTINLCAEFMESISDGDAAVIVNVGEKESNSLCATSANAALRAFSLNIDRENIRVSFFAPELNNTEDEDITVSSITKFIFDTLSD